MHVVILQVPTEGFAVDKMPLTDSVLSTWASLVSLVVSGFREKESRPRFLAADKPTAGDVMCNTVSCALRIRLLVRCTS